MQNIDIATISKIRLFRWNQLMEITDLKISVFFLLSL